MSNSNIVESLFQEFSNNIKSLSFLRPLDSQPKAIEISLKDLQVHEEPQSDIKIGNYYLLASELDLKLPLNQDNTIDLTGTLAVVKVLSPIISEDSSKTTGYIAEDTKGNTKVYLTHELLSFNSFGSLNVNSISDEHKFILTLKPNDYLTYLQNRDYIYIDETRSSLKNVFIGHMSKWAAIKYLSDIRPDNLRLTDQDRSTLYDAWNITLRIFHELELIDSPKFSSLENVNLKPGNILEVNLKETSGSYLIRKVTNIFLFVKEIIVPYLSSTKANQFVFRQEKLLYIKGLSGRVFESESVYENHLKQLLERKERMEQRIKEVLISALNESENVSK